MIKTLLPGRALPVLAALLFSLASVAQLPNFTLSATSTPQTCLGDGTLNLTVTGTDPEASIDYAVYLLPNTTDPVTVTTATTVNGLVAGNYLVVATQSLDGESNTSTANVTVANLGQPVEFSLTQIKERCGNDGVININVSAGTAVSFALSGPVNYPPQATPNFNNLTAGFYLVTVTDTCGNVETRNFTVLEANTNLIIDFGGIEGGELPTCNTITISNTYGTLSGYEIFYPLTAQVTVFPPGGGTPVVVTNTNVAGTFISADIPFYEGEEYSYTVQVTDACGNVFTKANNVINPNFALISDLDIVGCDGYKVTLRPANYMGPYTLEFLSPAGIDPADYNASHPTFDEVEVVYGGPGNVLPEGDYSVQITDACGRVATADFVIEPPEAEAVVVPVATSCTEGGSISIGVSGRDVASVTIEEAPEGYPFDTPHDASDYISEIGFFMEGLPIGHYEITIIDSCDDEYFEEAELELTDPNPLLGVLQHPGCEEGFGSIRLGSADVFLTTATITEWPAGFAGPFDVSSNIATSNGMLYMNSLPEGLYTFTTTDSCGVEREQDVIIEGYHIAINTIEVEPFCGLFNLELHHTSNGDNTHAFWLQKFDPVTGSWGHPEDGTPYVEGAALTPTNARFLTNNSNNINLEYVGEFRVVKTFFTYSNGTSTSTRCIEVLHNFTFEGGPVITEAYSFPCAGGLAEVAIIAEGVAPLTYRITTKDGEPFVVNNGTSNVFSGLEGAIYNFQVMDDCGNIQNILYDINELDPMEIVTQGTFCDGEESSLSVQQFSFLTYEWWEEGDPSTILSTQNTLVFPAFDSDTQSGTYHVTIGTADPDSCMNQELEFEIEPNIAPNAGADNTISMCNEGEEIDLTAYLDAQHDAGGTWEDVDGTAALTGSQLATEGLAEGTYQFRYTVTGMCDTSDDAIVTLELKDTPQPPVVAAVAPVCEGDTVQLSADEVAGATYQWEGPDNFASTERAPVITGAGLAAGGEYRVAVTVNGCTSPLSTVAVTVNAIPDFAVTGNTSLCEGQSSILSVVPENFEEQGQGVVYTWYHNEGLLDGVTAPAIEVSAVGDYRVVVDNNGCTSEELLSVTLNTAAFDVELAKGCENNEYVLSIVNIEDLTGIEFEWTGPDGYSHNGEEAIITGLAGGDYFVTATDANGCTVEASIPVDYTSCMIPKGISPNVDGLNDSFDLTNLGVEEIKIFNRYGIEVYGQKNYTDEWYGQSDKGELPTGTYFYMLKLADSRELTGWVYLQREMK